MDARLTNLHDSSRDSWITVNTSARVADQSRLYDANATIIGSTEARSRDWASSEGGSADDSGSNDSPSRRIEMDSADNTADSQSPTPQGQQEPGPRTPADDNVPPPADYDLPTFSSLNIGGTSPTASRPIASRSDQPASDTVDSQSATRQVEHRQESQTTGDSTPPANYNALFPWAPPSFSSLHMGGTPPGIESGPSASRSDSSSPREPPLSAAKEPDDDPLVAATRHNQTTPFHRLLDGILLGIHEHLDNTSIECLRRVSRRFPPLTAEVVRSRDLYYYARDSINRFGPFPWPLFKRMHSYFPEGRALLRLLDRDRCCAGCLRTREAPDWLERVSRLRCYHWCAACGVNHPACLFSQAQRRRQPSDRLCVAHEGYVRICGHEDGIVRWSDVLAMFERERAADPPAFNGRRCSDISHRTVCGEPGGDIRAEELSAPCASRQLNHYAICPSMCVARNLDSSTGKIKALRVSWLAHVPLGRLGEWPPTASVLRRRLRELSDNAGRFMTLTTRPRMQELPELRCFDPNDCDCVYFEGSEDVNWRPYRPLQQNKGIYINRNGASSKCYLDPARRLVPFPHRRRLSPSTRDRHLQRTSIASEPKRRCNPDAKECLVAETLHMHRARYPILQSLHRPNELSVSARLCHSEKPCIRIYYSRLIVNQFPVERSPNIPEHWYQSLDPDSYGLTSDADGCNVYWCREPECCNYYRGSPGFNRLLSGYRHLQGEVDYLGHLPYHQNGNS